MSARVAAQVCAGRHAPGTTPHLYRHTPGSLSAPPSDEHGGEGEEVTVVCTGGKLGGGVQASPQVDICVWLLPAGKGGSEA